MSREEFLKIQTCALKVNIHCDGCKHKVKKILHKIEGVYTTKIDSEQGKVTVSGNIDPETIIKKLTKNGKHAELWGAPKPNKKGNNPQLNNQFKNMKIDNGKGGNNNKGQGQKNGGNNNNQPKGGGGGQNQQLQGLQDLKLPPQFMKNMAIPPFNKNPNNQKSTAKSKLPEDEEDVSDYDDDDDCDDFDDDDLDGDGFDDVVDEPLNNKAKKPMLGNAAGHGGGGGPKMPNLNMMNNMLNGGGNNNGKNAGNKPNSGGNGKKDVNNGNNNQNQGGNNNKGGDSKNSGGKAGAQNKNGGGGNNNFNAGNKTNNGMVPSSNSMMPVKGENGNFAHNLSAAVQGLPAGAEQMGPLNNSFYQQQQMAAMMMNQQRANGNEQFQPMMYARPPPNVSYMPPHYPPYPYPPPPPGDRVDQYSMFSDENTWSCTIM